MHPKSKEGRIERIQPRGACGAEDRNRRSTLLCSYAYKLHPANTAISEAQAAAAIQPARRERRKEKWMETPTTPRNVSTIAEMRDARERFQ